MPILANPFPIYQPAMRIINAITNAYHAEVTTSFDHQYASGLVVRLNVPTGFGMTQANQLVGEIVVTGNTTFLIDIDTRLFDEFQIPIDYPASYQSATVVPIGEDNNSVLQALRNVLPYGAVTP